MIKCPFCHFENEDGALFCEQCKSDLAGVENVPTAEPVEAAIPFATAEVIETIPMMGVHEGMPVVEAVLAEPFLGSPVEALPVEAVAPIPFAPDASPPVQVSPHHASPMSYEPPSVPVMTPGAPTMQGVSPMHAPPTMSAAALAVAAHTAPLASAPTAPAEGAPATGAAGVLPPDAQPRLVVLRGLKRNVEYPIYEGHNFIGRADEKPVDIDLDDQEPPDRVWSSRQHSLITFEDGRLLIEDLNSSNGTFVNRARIYPGQKRELAVGDVVQIGTVQMKVIV